MKNITAGVENLQSPEPGRYVETYLVKDHVSSESNDLAVVYTTKNMHFNEKTQAICLPKEATEELKQNNSMGYFDDNIAGIFVMFQQEGKTARYTNKDDCNSWNLTMTSCSKVCVHLDHSNHQQRFFPKDSGAPLIQEERNFEVVGILADLDEDDGMNPGVFAYVKHPDNFEFIKSSTTS